MITDLTLSYCTLSERAGAITVPPQAQDAEVLVCVQGDLTAWSADPRWDRVVPVAGRGVARSRNVAIGHSTRRYLLFCDDDVTVDVAGVVGAARLLDETGAAIALGRAIDPLGALRKRYGRRVSPLTPYNCGKAATYELLVDVEQVRRVGIRFDERFGAGTPLHLGDEYIFITDLLRAGLRGYAVPHVFGVHPAASSGLRWSTADARVRSAVFDRVFGRRAPVLRLAFGLRHQRELGGLGGVLRFSRGLPTPPPGERQRTPVPVG